MKINNETGNFRARRGVASFQRIDRPSANEANLPPPDSPKLTERCALQNAALGFRASCAKPHICNGMKDGAIRTSELHTGLLRDGWRSAAGCSLLATRLEHGDCRPFRQIFAHRRWTSVFGLISSLENTPYSLF